MGAEHWQAIKLLQLWLYCKAQLYQGFVGQRVIALRRNYIQNKAGVDLWTDFLKFTALFPNSQPPATKSKPSLLRRSLVQKAIPLDHQPHMCNNTLKECTWLQQAKNKNNKKQPCAMKAFPGRHAGRNSAFLPLVCQSEQWPDANVCTRKFSAMNCEIQRSVAIWKLSDRKVFMRD